MKTQLMMAAVLAAVFALSSCSGENAKLAGELAGTWKGSTTQMQRAGKDGRDGDRKDDRHDGRDCMKPDHRDAAEMTCTPTITFVKSDASDGGDITITADYTVTQGIQTSDVSAPVRASVSGTFSASGTWTVKDGDEVLVALDATRTVVNVDTASMAVSYAKLTDAPKVALDSVRQRVAANISDVVKPMVAGKIQKMHKFDDVKITGNTMTLEAGHNRINFTRQQ